MNIYTYNHYSESEKYDNRDSYHIDDIESDEQEKAIKIKFPNWVETRCKGDDDKTQYIYKSMIKRIKKIKLEMKNKYYNKKDPHKYYFQTTLYEKEFNYKKHNDWHILIVLTVNEVYPTYGYDKWKDKICDEMEKLIIKLNKKTFPSLQSLCLDVIQNQQNIWKIIKSVVSSNKQDQLEFIISEFGNINKK